ncbi:acyl CoA:acetate/3-ketoacid CoA transferase [Desulfallas sp. Bu1-1]|uniref:acyl CoA:acetate/3-ketoacid CoA transferase n=1 Tax=Desulfallas sp. Bu1-1 TaxID=2787620 RepID=UPI00189C8E05|nr:CoA-transferase [Desulfallas sp. Bu1-1]MBF7082558.1 acyl CoA:acetate/3-ketoacid CoA transferase [Desulfallas sp. Bu1-1]
MSKVTSFESAAGLIKDGDTITACASAGMMVPEAMLDAIEKRFLSTGSPRNLTVFFPIAIGDRISLPGLDHLAHKGLIKRLIGGSYVLGRSDGSGNKIARMVLNNEVEAYNLPLGTMMQMLRDTAAKKPGTFTEVGLNTFVDPRQQGGKLNDITKEDLVELIELGGREWLWYKPIPIDVAIIRATTADENGNLTFEHEPATLGILAQVMAAKNNGGKVIAQVKRVTQKGSMNPHAVKVPGMLVDAIVVDPNQMQGTQTAYDPWLSGEVRQPLDRIEPMPFSADKVIARRAVMEFKQGMIINLGFGIPGNIPKIAVEEGFTDKVSFIIEQGSWGGLPVSGLQFGASANPQCIIDSGAQMDFIDGGGFDLTCLAFGEADANGSVNVSKLGLLIPGCGGFINIVNNVPRVVFCGYFTAGGLKVEIEDGRLKILQEGKFNKFTDKIEHITYSGEMMRKKQKEVIYVTERAVFKLVREGLEIIEVAPGIDVQKDVLDKLTIPVRVAADLKTMDPRLFRPEPMQIKL